MPRTLYFENYIPRPIVSCPLLQHKADDLQIALLKPDNVKWNLFVWRWYGDRVEIAWNRL